MNSDKNPILVIGLDGGTWRVLGPLIEHGDMPNLARLRVEGSWGNLRSTVPPFTAPAWSTFMTGKDPGQHGVLSFFEQDARSYRMMPGGPLATSAALTSSTVWDWLGQAGWRVGVVNVPLTYPPKEVNGFLITGLLTPGGASNFTFPAELAGELGTDYIVEPDYLQGIMGSFDLSQLPQRSKLLADLDRIEEIRTAACLRLCEQHSPDFFMVVYASTDRISHFFWDCVDSGAGDAPQSDATEIAAGVTAHYRRLDHWIGELQERMGPHVTTLLMSDHGFGPSASRWVHVNSWLRDMGLLHTKRSPRGSWTNPAYWKSLLGSSPLRGWIRALMPARARRVAQRAERIEDIVDWPTSSAYFRLLYANVAGIMINLQGRQQEGIVTPGTEYESLRDRIVGAARRWVDPHTGVPLVVRADRREEFFTGPRVDDFPDVILEFAPEYSAVATLHPDTVTIIDASVRNGEHRPEGILLAHGDRVQPGIIEGAAIADLAPTLLHLAGVPVPEDMSGRVLAEMLDPAWLAGHAIQRSPGQDSHRTQGAVYSEEEEALLREHLAGLGYL